MCANTGGLACQRDNGDAFANQALHYAKIGLRVFPVEAGSGIGPEHATTDELRIRAWGEKFPHAQVAVDMGRHGPLIMPRPEEPHAGCVGRQLAAIEPRSVQWLWPGYIARGKISIIVGDPGLGKSYLTMDIAARVSNGLGWPTEPGVKTTPEPVVLLNGEDDAHDTIRPRLDALDGNALNVYLIEGVRRTVESETVAHLNLHDDIEHLERRVCDCSARLVVIDPLNAYMGSRMDGHRDTDVRSVLSPLRDFAERQDVAVICVMHPPKGKADKALHAVMGSVAYVAAARLAWLITEDPDDTNRRLFMPIKTNLPAVGAGLRFNITEGGQIAWYTGVVKYTADQALRELQGSDRSSRDEATDFLREVLADGPVPSKEIQKLAGDAGIARRTLWRAKEQLGIRAAKVGGPGTGEWNWELGA